VYLAWPPMASREFKDAVMFNDVANDSHRRDEPDIDVAEGTGMIKHAGVTEYVGVIEAAGAEDTSEAGNID